MGFCWLSMYMDEHWRRLSPLLTSFVWDSSPLSLTSMDSGLHKSGWAHEELPHLILLPKPILKMSGLEVSYTLVSASPGIKKYLWETSQKAQACILLSKHFPTSSSAPIALHPGEMSHCMTVSSASEGNLCDSHSPNNFFAHSSVICRD